MFFQRSSASTNAQFSDFSGPVTAHFSGQGGLFTYNTLTLTSVDGWMIRYHSGPNGFSISSFIGGGRIANGNLESGEMILANGMVFATLSDTDFL